MIRLTLFLLCLSVGARAQKIVWEMVDTRSGIAKFRPKGLAVLPSGSIYVTGQYERESGYYKEENGKFVKADSTLADIGLFGTMFLFKYSTGGKLIKRTFVGGLSSEYRKLKPEDLTKGDLMLPSVAQGSTITATRNGQLLISGFATGYRKKNYEGDHAQGVFAALADSNLQFSWDAFYPSYYNSNPAKAIETEDGNWVILANVNVNKKEISKYYSVNVTAPRIIKISDKGKLLEDTLLQDKAQQDDWDYVPGDEHSYLDGEAQDIVVTDNGGYLIAGTATGQKNNLQHNSALLMATDKNFAPTIKKTYDLFQGNKYIRPDFIGGNIAIQRNIIAFTGVAQHEHPPCYTAFIKQDSYDTISIAHVPGDVFSYPGIAAIGNNMFAMCVLEDKQLKLYMLTSKGIQKTIDLKKYNITDFVDMQVMGGYVYILGSSNKGCYLAKVSIK